MTSAEPVAHLPSRIPLLKDTATLALVAAIAASVLAAAAVVAAIADIYTARQLAQAERESVLALLVSAVSSSGMIIMAVVSWILTALWLNAVRANVTTLTGRTHTHGRVSSFVSWIIPVINLYLPFAVVREVHRAAVERPGRQVPLGLWWATWLGFEIATRINARLYAQQGAGEAASAVVISSVLVVLLAVVSLACWLRIIQRTEGGLSDRLAAR